MILVKCIVCLLFSFLIHNLKLFKIAGVSIPYQNIQGINYEKIYIEKKNTLFVIIVKLQI